MEISMILKIAFMILILLYIFSLFHCYKPKCSSSTVEHYEERLGGSAATDVEDMNDPEFIDIYELVYRDSTDSKIWSDLLKNKSLDNIKDPSKINVLIGGCGVNKTGAYLKKYYSNITCVDNSANMLLKAQKLNPQMKYIHGDLRNQNTFKKGEFSHILLDERVLYYHKLKDIEKIIENCNYWLADQGFLLVPVYDYENLDVGARYYTTNYIDDKENLHGFTYFNNFSHDCYYIQDESEKGLEEGIFYYYDKIILDNGKKRVKRTDLFFHLKDEIYTLIMNRFFKLFYLEPYKAGTQLVGGYETALFRKERKELDVTEIQKKYA
jgi:hypothetical protein